MNIGLLKEVKDNEYRVGLVPAGVHALDEDGHTVFVEKGAGLGSGFSDKEYTATGAKLVDTADEVFVRSDMVVKVKEPTQEEYPRLREGQILSSYLHLAPNPELTRALLDQKGDRRGLRNHQRSAGKPASAGADERGSGAHVDHSRVLLPSEDDRRTWCSFGGGAWRPSRFCFDHRGRYRRD